MAKKSTKNLEKSTITTSYLDKIEAEVQANQSKFNLILGGLIVLVVGLLVFNYFSKDNSEVGPSQQTDVTQNGDVSPENLPGKYTIKEGDTLFQVAEKYYQDGYKYTEIVKANNLTSPDLIETGQMLEIPKLEATNVLVSAGTENTQSPQPSPSQTSTNTPTEPVMNDWGASITGNTYVVAEGDWLSTIAARAYNGDVMSYSKIATANNLSNPDVIEPGMVLTIPR